MAPHGATGLTGNWRPQRRCIAVSAGSASRPLAVAPRTTYANSELRLHLGSFLASLRPLSAQPDADPRNRIAQSAIAPEGRSAARGSLGAEQPCCLTGDPNLKLSDYLAVVSSSLATFLRPERGTLPPRYLGIDRSQRTFLLRRSTSGFSALLIGKWLGSPVAEARDESAGTILRGRFTDAFEPPGTETQVSFFIKRLTGVCNSEVRLTHDWRLEVELKSPDSTLLLIGPELMQGLTPVQAAAFRAKEYSGPAPRYATPNWVLGIVSNVGADDPLLGLDPDPIIAASGFAEAILSTSGSRLAHEPDRFGRAAAELRWAVTTLSPDNEAVLQNLVEDKPWILLHEAEYDDVLPRPRIELLERMPDGHDERRQIEPDFVYHQPDSQSLVVEIESAKKRLHLLATETGYALPASRTVQSLFQILNYRHEFSGPLGAQVRRRLGKPDSWAFRYLLVVGSRLQRDFDERSWVVLRDQLQSAGVELRHWDYYIDRLDRIARMAKTEPLRPTAGGVS